MKSSFAILLFALLVTPLSVYCRTERFSLFYASGESALNGQQEAGIDSFLYFGDIGGATMIRITAYADEPGTTALNKQIAQRRAFAVKQYLLKSGIGENQIESCVGAGHITGMGNDPHQRRTDLDWSKRPANAEPVRSDSAEINSVKDRPIEMLKPGDAVELRNIFFQMSSSILLEESFPALNKLASTMKQFPKLKIRLEGHVCCGDKPSNELSGGWFSISEDRAKSVMDYLIARGISRDRLAYQGLGFSKPKVFPERSSADREKNRRVEIRIIEN